MELLKSDFYYELPEELIAQTPIEPRNASRMMCVDRKTGAITRESFITSRSPSLRCSHRL